MSADLFPSSPLNPDPFAGMPVAEPNACELGNRLAAAERRLVELEQKLAQVSKICGALAEVADLRGERLATALVAAEKRRAEVFTCTKCRNVLQRAIAKCIYCGATNPHVTQVLP
jgi:hypothetical protein